MSDTPHQPCPFEDCGSSDAFNWNEDGYGFCHSCGEAYPSKNKLRTFGVIFLVIGFSIIWYIKN